MQSMVQLTGGEMESLVQVLEVCLLKLVTEPQELKCWEIHIDILRQLARDELSDADLAHLHNMTLEWKEMIYDLYHEVLINEKKKEPAKKTKTKKPTTTKGKAKVKPTPQVCSLSIMVWCMGWWKLM
jgi:hypothetical protein